MSFSFVELSSLLLVHVSTLSIASLISLLPSGNYLNLPLLCTRSSSSCSPRTSPSTRLPVHLIQDLMPLPTAASAPSKAAAARVAPRSVFSGRGMAMAPPGTAPSRLLAAMNIERSTSLPETSGPLPRSGSTGEAPRGTAVGASVRTCRGAGIKK